MVSTRKGSFGDFLFYFRVRMWIIIFVSIIELGRFNY